MSYTKTITLLFMVAGSALLMGSMRADSRSIIPSNSDLQQNFVWLRSHSHHGTLQSHECTTNCRSKREACKAECGETTDDPNSVDDIRANSRIYKCKRVCHDQYEECEDACHSE